MLTTKLVSAMEKCFLDQIPADFDAVTKLRMYKNEKASVQFMAYDDTKVRTATFLKISIEGEMAKFATLRTVENIPNYNSMPFILEDMEIDIKYIRTEAGLYPDVLMPLMRKNCIPYYNRQLHTVMIDFEGDLKPGQYETKIVLHDLKDEKVAETVFVVEVIDAELPERDTIATQWFYADCLADYYNVPAFSDRHFEICKNFMKKAVETGINMILMPVFTPPLDTYEGGERTTVQLVKVNVNKGEYSFDFSLCDRWLSMCKDCGVKYVEVCHLFTQWGAYHAPKVIATVDGEEKRIFGWDTDAAGEEYVKFIRAFLTEFTKYIVTKWDKDKVYFHISDEPREQHLEQYKTNRNNIIDILKDFKVIDALSHVEYYKEGLCDIPVPTTYAIKDFLPEDIKERWVYYCSTPRTTTNRGFALSTPRTRSLGYQMYKFGIEGFLHWGFNYYNNETSYDHINPFLNPCGGYFGYEMGGDCFLVYPAQDGTPIDSLRLMATRQALDDIRLLKLCESYYGKEKVVEEIENIIGEITFLNNVNDVRTMQKIRDRIDDMILEAMK
ncbi:MAG: DUF4091 domain-containing protein [Clostridia bacterium]|nr:DUF4091 domain-containing protein [Clostridia bacterium]